VRYVKPPAVGIGKYVVPTAFAADLYGIDEVVARCRAGFLPVSDRRDREQPSGVS
jgi:hypothetical protein